MTSDAEVPSATDIWTDSQLPRQDTGLASCLSTRARDTDGSRPRLLQLPHLFLERFDIR